MFIECFTTSDIFVKSKMAWNSFNSKFCINPKNAFINVGLFFENRQEARKLGLLPPGKSFEAVCERLEPQERKERVFKGQPYIDDFNCIIWVRIHRIPAQ
jgi:hypothetical protein